MTLVQSLPARLTLAPVVGFALMASVLTSAAYVMPMKTAAWTLLLPATVVSCVLAFRVGRKTLGHDIREIAVPAALVFAGLIIALLPVALRDTVGPSALEIYDSAYYINGDLWLLDYSLRDPLPASATSDVSLANGYGITRTSQRLGVNVTNSAASVLFATSPDETQLAFLGALYALLPATIWFAALLLGVGRIPAAAGAFFGLSPAILNLVNDSALANLAGLLLAPAALALGARGLVRGSIRTLALAAILSGGLTAVFPEFLPPLLLSGAVGMAALVAWRFAQRDFQARWLLALGGRAVLLVVGVVVLAPVALLRAALLFSGVFSNMIAKYLEDLPSRSLTLENTGAWAFGLLHIYELPQFDLLSKPEIAFFVILPILLSLVILWGIFREGAQGIFFVLGPVVVSLLLGLYVYNKYGGNRCEYCAWKSFTLILPFLGVGIALGLHRLMPLLRGGGFARAIAVGAVFFVLLGAVAIVRADAKVATTQYHSPAIVPTDLREIAEQVEELPKPATVLLEGEDASARPAFTLPPSYYLLSQVQGTRISFNATIPSAAYLVGYVETDEAWQTNNKYYATDYSYVMTPFPGLRSQREPIAQQGPYGLFRRAPIDVGITDTRWAWDPDEGNEAIPWVTKPFKLRISSEQSGPIALSVLLSRPFEDDSALRLRLDGKRVRSQTSTDGSRVCFDVPLEKGLTVLDAKPQFATIPDFTTPPITWLSENEPLPPPPKILGLSAVKAEPGWCSKTGG